MAGPISYERQQRQNELKSADALARIADVLEKIYAHLTGATMPAQAAQEPPIPADPSEDTHEPE